uniref:Golgi apparatus membrane protein TVP23 homolog n=1 Tax=Meloidogyne javanica TaxID=6303 RepID=A0A915LH64_MELJA
YLQGDCITDSDDESGTTKSTVRHHNFVRIFHPGPSTSCQTIEHRPSLPFSQIPRRKSGFSTTTSNHATIPEDQTSQPSTLQSMQMEELLLTDKILFVRYARPFLWLSTVLLGVALQLLIFSIVCVFFDVICGCACLLILLINYSANNIDKVHKGLFLSRTAGHQNVLVPVKLRQVAKIENGEVRSE